ncbi:hypothetical protein FRC05_001608 [Tulasnella sp. 425]|nr:hypothetical protein FRC05_001608 [Tulasnella sp. 425]
MATLQDDKAPKFDLANVPLDIFLDIVRFLDVQHTLRLRRVCRSLAHLTQSHSVWAAMANQHVIQQLLPWPTWALPLSVVSTQTLEVLCVRAIRLLGWWDDVKVSRKSVPPSGCILRPENSVTWLSICLSRWLVVQLNGQVLEFWDLENTLETCPSPRASFDGVDGIINGGRIFHDSPENCTLVISTRSDLAYALELRLSGPGIPASSAHVRLVRSWTGYSELLDATSDLWAFARTCTKQTATILHCLSGRSVNLVGTEDDELVGLFRITLFGHIAKKLLRKQRNLPGAIQIGHQDIAVARSHSLDIYSMESVMSVLNNGVSAATTGAVRPFQSLAYPSAWTGSGLTFVPNRPPWLRSKAPREDDIYLTLTEDEIGYSVALVAHKETERGAGEPSYGFERPYYLFGPEDPWIAALSWGDSARRAVSVIGEATYVLLCGISIPSNGDPLDDQWDNMDRIVARWRIPHGEKDFTRFLAFDEPTGRSVVAMASGHIWIADPTIHPVGSVAPFNPASLIYPDPAWPLTRSSPWLRRTETRVLDEDYQEISPWTSAVDEFFTDKNRPNSFGGATWFVNEVLHIRGTAEVFQFTVPFLTEYAVTELIRLDERVLIIGRDYGMGIHEAWLLTAGSTVESVKAHLHAGGTIGQLSKIKLAVDELPTRQFALWSHRTEPNNPLHL